MRKTIAVGIVFLAIGGAIGWIAGKYNYGFPLPLGLELLDNPRDTGAIPPEPQMIGARYRAGHQDLLDAVPSWQEWKYPNSSVHGSGKAGGFVLGKIRGGDVFRIALVSKDDFDKVWSFYKEAVQDRQFKVRRGTTSHRDEGEVDENKLTVTIFDNVYACTVEGPKSDLLQAKGMWIQSLRFNLAVFVYHTRGSDSTDILLFYRPCTEFLGLLKEKLVNE